MNIESMISEVNRIFKQNILDFCQNHDTSQLTEDLATDFSGTLKTAVSQMGVAAFSKFIESYDVSDEVILADGQVSRYKYHSAKPFLSPFGAVKINRKVFQNDRGGKAVIPLDRKWGMEREYATPDVREAVIFSCAHNTPEETVKIFQKVALFEMHATTIKRIVDKTGRFFHEEMDSLKSDIFHKEEIPRNFDVLVASMDGVNVLLNEAGVKKGRPVERPNKKMEEEKHCAYKNAMCGSISFYQSGDGTKDNRAERILGRYVSKMPEDRATTFKSDLEKELENLNSKLSGTPVQRVMLCDGARSIWSYVENSALYRDYRFLVDFYHATEHLSKAAEAIFGKSSREGKKWYNKWYKRLQEKDGAAHHLYRSLLNYRNAYNYPDSRLKALEAEITFFRRNNDKMQYHEFLSAGLPIGSGPVEAACKSIVKQRMCRSGQRWSREKGDNILQFRTLIKSDRWEICWNWYREHKKVA